MWNGLHLRILSGFTDINGMLKCCTKVKKVTKCSTTNCKCSAWMIKDYNNSKIGSDTHADIYGMVKCCT